MKGIERMDRGMLIDLDGTIVDSREAYREAAETAFRAMGKTNISPRIVTEIPRRLEQNMPADDLLRGIDPQEFLKNYLATYYSVTSEKTKPWPSVSEALRRLSERAKLAVVTMRYVPRETVLMELEKFSLRKYFEYAVTAFDTKRSKPFPDALTTCARGLGVNIDNCLVVGDSVADIRAGKAAGARTVAVLSGLFSLSELQVEKPDLIIENIKKLPDFVDLILK